MSKKKAGSEQKSRIWLYFLTIPVIFILMSSGSPSGPGKPVHKFDFLHPASYKKRPSPNRTRSDRTAEDIDAIVIHTLQAQFQEGVSYLCTNEANVSAHFVISRDGFVAELVPVKDIAWHARYYNDRSIGIECEGFAENPETWTRDLMNTLVRLVAYLTTRYRIPVRHPSSKAEKPKKENGGYDEPLDESGILSHGQIDPSRRRDPGPYFDWTSFIRRVKSVQQQVTLQKTD